MNSLENRFRWDVVAGAVMIGIATVFLMVGLQLSFGSLRRMGPGFLPVCTAVALIALGAVTIMDGLRNSVGERPDFPAFRPLLAIVASPIVFAVLIERLGMAPTVVIVALLARMAEPLRWGWDLVLVPLGLVLLSVLVFIEFLGVAIPIF